MSDAALRRLERAAQAPDATPEDVRAWLLAASRYEPEARAQLALLDYMVAPTPGHRARLAAVCSDPAHGLAYDSPAWGRMVYVPEHVSIMGSGEGDAVAYKDETPRMAVHMPAYWIAQRPATPAQWVAAGGAAAAETPTGFAASVSWLDATRVLRSRDEGAGASGRVHRGGGWRNDASYCRAAIRDWSSPGNRGVNLGFRPARSVEGSGASLRVIRGGGWSYVASNCRAALRYWNSPGFRDDNLGFRPARSAPDDRGYRLPTEDEWEAAARGPHGAVYPWGDDWRPLIEDRRGPGGASCWGVEDMSGVVWQWTVCAWNARRHGERPH